MKPGESVGAPKGDGGLMELPLVWTELIRHKNYVTHLLKEAKSAFLAEFISQNADEMKVISSCGRPFNAKERNMFLRLCG